MELQAEDLVRGVLCGLWLNGVHSVGFDARSWSRAVEAAYEAYEDRYETHQTVCDFQIVLDPIHGDSGVAFEALMQNFPIAVLQAPHLDIFRIELNHERIGTFLADLPGNKAMWQEVARAFDQAHAQTPLTAR
jgi:hypothetical protein